MKILVFSDSHRRTVNMENVIDKIGDKINCIVHLGDMDDDQKFIKLKYPQFEFYGVKGNNYYGCETDEVIEFVKSGRRFLLTHGHRQQVHWNYSSIYYWAQEKQADIVLFGHTHTPECDGNGSVILFNPGSITLPRSTSYPTFGIIDISDIGVINCSIMEYKDKNSFKILKTC